MKKIFTLSLLIAASAFAQTPTPTPTATPFPYVAPFNLNTVSVYLDAMSGTIPATSNSTIASAATLNINNVTGPITDVTGTTTITAITLTEGEWRALRFTGALTLTHGANLQCPGDVNILTVAGGFAVVIGKAAGVVQVRRYFPSDFTIRYGGDFSTGGTFSALYNVLFGGAFSTGGEFSTQGAFVKSGTHDTQITTTATTNVTLPTSGTLLATINVASTAHGFVVGDVLRMDGANYVKAQSDSEVNAEVVGMVAAVPNANNFTLATFGNVSGLSGLTAGATYFLDPATAGALTATEPSAVGQVSKPVFIAVSTTAGYFFNMRGALIEASGVSGAVIGTAVLNLGSDTATPISAKGVFAGDPTPTTFAWDTGGGTLTIGYGTSPATANDIPTIVFNDVNVTARVSGSSGSTLTIKFYHGADASAAEPGTVWIGMLSGGP